VSVTLKNGMSVSVSVVRYVTFGMSVSLSVLGYVNYKADTNTYSRILCISVLGFVVMIRS
jgi:hypothetical protein